MDIRQLELFVAAAQEGHFTKAAVRENIVQSGLSVAIRSLEDELGVKLFNRTTRRVQLSEAGRILLPQAQRVLATVEAARRSITEAKQGLAGRVSVSIVPSLSPYLDIADVAVEFHRRHPMVDIRIQESVSDFERHLLDGRLDLAFVPLFGTIERDLVVDVLVSEPMVVVLPPDHEKAGEQEINLQDLDGAPFVDASERWLTRQLVDRIFLSAQVTRKIVVETENIDLLLKFVSAGFGAGMLPLSLVSDKGLPVLSIRQESAASPLLRWELALFRRRADDPRTTNAAADVFRTLIHQHMRRRK